MFHSTGAVHHPVYNRDQCPHLILEIFLLGATRTQNMGDITTCRVINKHDDSLITIFTEWPENSIKITIFTSGSTPEPLVGEMKSSDVEKFATNLTKSRLAYLDATRLILSGRDSGVVFVLKDSVLRWKRGAWNHGLIELAAAPLVDLFPSVLDRLLARHEALENSLTGEKAENEKLKASLSRLEEKTEEMIRTKNQLEADLYRRFAAVLNSKKAKIRELDEELKPRNGNKTEDLFEAKTDDSEDSESEDVETLRKSNLNGNWSKRREEEETEENRKTKKKQRKSSEEVDVRRAEASTSRSDEAESISGGFTRIGGEKLFRKDSDIPMKNDSVLNFSCEDSEDDFFS